MITNIPKKYVVDEDTGCWLWQGFKNDKGYGRTNTWYKGKWTNRSVHRIMFEIHRGEVPDGLYLDHLCRVRHCCNPAHLEPVTPQENTRRGNAGKAKRDATHCTRGHEYTEDNTIWPMAKNGKRYRLCKQCCADKHQAERVTKPDTLREYRRRADAKRNTPEFRAKKAEWAREHRAKLKSSCAPSHPK